jgi:hypothetical protein
MDEYFEELIERAQYYEKFEIFREHSQKVHVGLNRSEQFQKEVMVAELILKQKEKED